MTYFTKQITAFNTMYGLPVNTVPCFPFPRKESLTKQFKERMKELKKILQDEVEEVDEIVQKMEAGESLVTVLAELADWLADIQVYCASEMCKFGLDSEAVLTIIMESNMSKLAADGTVIMKDGKVMKGPNYWKPEPLIKELIKTAISGARGDIARLSQRKE